MLQFLLAAILLTFGLLIEIRSTATVEGAGALLLAVPGGVILLAMIIEFFKIKTKSVWYYVPVYLVLTLLAEGVAIYCFGFYRYFGPRIVVLLLVVIFVTTAICQLFHYIHYVANKKPRII